MALWKENFLGQLTAFKKREHPLFLVFSCVWLWKGSHYILLCRSSPVPVWNFCDASLKFFSVTLFYTLVLFFFFKYVKRTRQGSSPVHVFPSLLLKLHSWLQGLFTLQLYSWKSLDRHWNMSLFCPSDGAQLPEATCCGWTQAPAKTAGKRPIYWEKNWVESNTFVKCATSNC